MKVDDRLIRALYAEHGQALRSYALRMTNGDLGLAQDAVQEVLLRAWQHRESLDPARGTIRAWLVRTLRNVLIDEFRARSVRPEAVTDELPETGVADGTDDALQSWLVAEALGQLTPAHQDVIRECFFQGRSVPEAAASLGLAPGTVKSRTHRALQALRGALIGMGVTP